MRPLRFLLPLSLVLTSLAVAFTPPSAADRAAALGPLDDEPATLQRLLEPDGDFDPIRPPAFGDWLDRHHESGQTFAAYTRSGFNRPTAKRNTIYLLPLGDFPEENSPSLETLRTYAEAFFQLDVRVLPAATLDEKLFKPRINDGTQKRQLHTLSILDHLKSKLPADAYCLLGVTMEDLYPHPKWNYVFGQASLVERVGVYSFARYDPAFFGEKRTSDYRRVILWRSSKVLTHEAGHMFGLHHCIHFHCVMNGANNLEESDSHPQHLCPLCLRKLHYNVQFDPVTRYADLHKFYKTHDWDDETSWTARQLEKVKSR